MAAALRIATLLILALVAAACSSASTGSSPAASGPATTSTTGGTSSSTQAVQYFPIWVDFPGPGQAWGLFWEQYSAQGCAMAVAGQGLPGVFVLPSAFGNFTCGNKMPVDEVVGDGLGDVFAYGPGLFVSHDSGKTFTRDAQPGTVLAISAIGRSVWLLEAVCPAGAGQSTTAVPCPLELFTSGDGGKTFARDSGLPAALVPAGSVSQGSGLANNWLQRASAQVAYIFVPPFRDAQPGSAATNAEVVYRSSDGGKSWTRSSIGGCANAMYADGSVNPQGQAMVVCAAQPGAGFQPKAAFVSPDGGATWKTGFNCLSLSSTCMNEPLNNGYLGLVAFVSPTTAFAGGGRSQLLVSHDQGASWSPVPGVGYGGDTYSGAFFGSRGYIFGDNGSVSQGYIWTTTDLGASWGRVPVKVAQG